MTYSLGPQSRAKLAGVHPDLVRVVELAITRTPVDFRITEGLRTVARQRQLVAQGASKTMNSRHITGHAIDFVPLIAGKPSWAWPPFHPIAKAFKEAAAELGVPIIWGGDWKSFKDGPHVELDRRTYP